MLRPAGKLCWIALVVGSSAAFAQQYSITTVAGGAPPPTPVAAASTSIGQPNRATADSSGNIYFSSDNCVFKLDSGGNLTLIAGNSRPGFSGDGGPATKAQLNGPQGLAFDSSGNLYIADAQNNRIRVVSKAGVINTFAGTGAVSPGGNNTFNDGGLATNALLHLPAGVAVDSSKNVYIADTGDNIIRKVTPDGIINTIAGDSYGSYKDNGLPLDAEFKSPQDVAVDSKGNVYVSDSYNAIIRKVGTDNTIVAVAGLFSAQGLPTTGYSGDGGAATKAGLIAPFALTIDGSGNIYFVENGDSRVRKIDSSGNITTLAGTGTAGFSGDGSTASKAQLNSPTGLAVDSNGNVYIADNLNRRVRKIASGNIQTVAGNGQLSYSGDGGSATSAQLNAPQTVAVDGSGNFYIADTANNVVRKVASNGTITTIAGNGTAGFGGDGGNATSAQLNGPQGIAVDGSGNVYVSDTLNARVRKISGGTINTVAGSGTPGFGGDGGSATAAQLNLPAGLAVDASGNLYIADFSNNRIRKVSGGTITTIAGNGLAGYSGDGSSATNAQLTTPLAVAVDASGNVYIADTGNNAVRLVANGAITTVAGNGLAGYSGDGGLATAAMVGNPSGIAVDTSGNIYVSEGSTRVRKIYPTGYITTIGGSGVRGYSGDGAPFGTLNGPSGVAVASNGNVYVADTGNNAIRMLILGGFQLKVSAVVSGASNLVGPVAGGEVVVIYGTNLGPAVLAQAQPAANGQIGTSLGGTSVYFGSYAAPVLYTSANQVAAIVPYEVSGSAVQMIVEYRGDFAPSFSVSTAQTFPGIFTADLSGKNLAAAINIHAGVYSYNDAAHPANAGDYVELFLTGTGAFKPPLSDGQVTPDANTLIAANVTATVGGKAATVQYAGGAPGYVGGLSQVNIQIPAGLPAGLATVTVQVGSTATQAGVSIAVSGK